MKSPQTIAAAITALIILSVLLWFMDFSLPEINLSWPEWTLNREVSSDRPDKPRTKRSDKVFTTRVVDTYKGVKIFDNGAVRNTHGRNVAEDGYNLGLKYQCVEFVKRFYYEYYNHKMPDSYGNARDFFDEGVPSGQMNKARALIQFTNGGSSPPKVNDILVYGPASFNKFGHVAIVSKVGNGNIQIVQQNPGKGRASRESLPLISTGNTWKVDHPYVKGWLRKP